ncbi:AEC family transporter [Sediminimonas sp.]|uniref:AEC family transporter n=1 Tax=Sediminimonas sp. TaxID=2823379 RepID=UPI0025D37CD9|nr:AEC family transporter [Sediminimonas sp.]
MIEILLKTVPFFAVIGLGYGAARSGAFTQDATAWLTRFVFYFALSAMLFRFAANLSLAEVFNLRIFAGYLWATAFVYGIVTIVAFLRGLGVAEAAVEAQCGVIGNVGFLGVPMLVMLLGEAAIGPVMLVLSIDLIVFGTLIVILITGSREGQVSPRALRTIGHGLVRNPMIMSIAAGLLWAGLGVPVPGVLNDFLVLLGGAATPGALFAIGASLATKSAERVAIAGWLSFAKLVLHPAFVAFAALVLFPVEPFAAGVVIAAASLPVAGNVYILAQHYGIAPHRASASILFSTVCSTLTVPIVIGLVTAL